MMLVYSKKSLKVQTNLNTEIEGKFDYNYTLNMNHEQSGLGEQIITINNIKIPIKCSDSVEQFLPSRETMSAWYLANYGSSNLLDLEPQQVGESIEKLANWWVSISTKMLN